MGLSVSRPFRLEVASRGPTADADWLARSTAAGVVAADRFDVLVLAPTYPEDGYYRSAGGSTPCHAAGDASIRCSGAQSLRIDGIDAAADTGGFYIRSLGRTFGEGSTFFLQFRYRLSAPMLDGSGGGRKVSVIHYAFNSCSEVEITVQNTYYAGHFNAYTNCGSIHPDLLAEIPIRADRWTTLYQRADVGTWGSPDSRIRMWAGAAGEALTQFVDWQDFTIYNNPPVYPGFDRITLTPYDTGADRPPGGSVWYDELIVSTEPIAPPAALPLSG